MPAVYSVRQKHAYVFTVSRHPLGCTPWLPSHHIHRSNCKVSTATHNEATACRKQPRAAHTNVANSLQNTAQGNQGVTQQCSRQQLAAKSRDNAATACRKDCRATHSNVGAARRKESKATHSNVATACREYPSATHRYVADGLQERAHGAAPGARNCMTCKTAGSTLQRKQHRCRRLVLLLHHPHHCQSSTMMCYGVHM